MADKLRWTARAAKREQALDSLRRAVTLAEGVEKVSFRTDTKSSWLEQAMFHARTAAELLRQTDGVGRGE